MEATVADIHAAFAAGELNARQLVEAYLARIEAYDRKGPALHSVIKVNPHALAIADELDRRYVASGPVGPLHGIPVLLKDNFDTFDVPTTNGNLGMRDFQPTADATTVGRMREAGAIILAKVNLGEFARNAESLSSLGGQVVNPYDHSRTPGGSSGGTGAAIAANFGVLGTGSDTGQSIRSPASACSLVGVRPTRGLISRAGIAPNSFTQDEIGPITRTVTDAALMMDAMAGFDPADPVTAFCVGRTPASYVDGLSADALDGVTIGIMTNLYGAADRHAEVNEVMAKVAKVMRAQGATLVEFELPEYEELSAVVDNATWESRSAVDRYLRSAPADAPVHSMADIVETRTAVPSVQQALETQLAITDGLADPEYMGHTLNRDKLRLAVATKMATLGLDAILYPLQMILVAPVGEPQLERNGVLSHGTGLPAVCFPGGFSSPSDDAPLGVPIGAELLGREYSEPLLLSLAYAFEQATHHRKPPASTPAL